MDRRIFKNSLYGLSVNLNELIIPAMLIEDHLTQYCTSLGVTSRTVVWLFLGQLRLEFVPVLHRLQGRLAAQGVLRELLVVEYPS